MDAIASLIKYAFLGLLALLGLLVVVALLFGKRVKKHWEYEAEFRDENGREYGEFDIELSQIEKTEPRPTVKAKLQMRHSSLAEHQIVQVRLDKRVILEGMVETAGRIVISRTFGEGDFDTVQAGQVCHVMVGGTEFAAEPLQAD